jgi:hypothetical protein
MVLDAQLSTRQPTRLGQWQGRAWVASTPTTFAAAITPHCAPYLSLGKLVSCPQKIREVMAI